MIWLFLIVVLLYVPCVIWIPAALGFFIGGPLGAFLGAVCGVFGLVAVSE